MNLREKSSDIVACMAAYLELKKSEEYIVEVSGNAFDIGSANGGNKVITLFFDQNGSKFHEERSRFFYAHQLEQNIDDTYEGFAVFHCKELAPFMDFDRSSVSALVNDVLGDHVTDIIIRGVRLGEPLTPPSYLEVYFNFPKKDERFSRYNTSGNTSRSYVLQQLAFYYKSLDVDLYVQNNQPECQIILQGKGNDLIDAIFIASQPSSEEEVQLIIISSQYLNHLLHLKVKIDNHGNFLGIAIGENELEQLDDESTYTLTLFI